MNLVIFDIDGTLTDTTRIDDECYQRVLETGFGITNIRLGLGKSDPDNYTDAGYIRAIFLARLGRLPTDADILLIKTEFKRMLHEEQLRSASAIKEIPGANDIINSLRNHPDWKPAIATGGWHDWAVYKLKCTDLLFPEIPIATSDDAPTRRMIVQHSIERACRQYGVSKFEKMVAIGDNIWDVKTAKLLNLPFIGVGNRDLLLQEGTGTVIDNYLDQQQFMDGLNNAGVPR